MLPGKAILARNNRVTIPRPHKKMKHVLHGLLIFYGYQNHCSDVHFGGSRSQLSSTNKNKQTVQYMPRFLTCLFLKSWAQQGTRQESKKTNC